MGMGCRADQAGRSSKERRLKESHTSLILGAVPPRLVQLTLRWLCRLAGSWTGFRRHHTQPSAGVQEAVPGTRSPHSQTARNRPRTESAHEPADVLARGAFVMAAIDVVDAHRAARGGGSASNKIHKVGMISGIAETT